MNVLVTGAAGFIGSWLTDYLVDNGNFVVGIDNLSGGYLRNVNQHCLFYQLDLRERKAVDDIIRNNDIEVIYHLAAYAAEGQSFFSPIEINDINIRPMNNLLVSAINNDVKRFVFTSSMAVYGAQQPPFDEQMDHDPVDPYGAAKAYCENMLEIYNSTFGLEYCIIRPHNVYGPRQNISDPYRNVLGIWMNRIMRGKAPIIYGDGEQTRAFSYIEDIVAPLANAGTSNVNKEIINLGGSKPTTINEACEIVRSVSNCQLASVHLLERPGEVKHAYCTIDKSKRLLDYNDNHSLRHGVSKMFAWAKQIGPTEPTYTLPLEIIKNAPSTWVHRSM